MGKLQNAAGWGQFSSSTPAKPNWAPNARQHVISLMNRRASLGWQTTSSTTTSEESNIDCSSESDRTRPGLPRLDVRLRSTESTVA